MLSKEHIVNLLSTNDRAVCRALLVLNERQTQDEQVTENTRYLNGTGFRPCHARMGTSMAKFFQRNGYLSPKQLAYWRARDRSGAMRIGIYWKQLAEAAEAKKKAKAPLPGLNGSPFSTTNPMHPDTAGCDFGNDMEYRAVLQEQLGDVLDSDDPALIDPIKQEIDELDAFWAKVRGNSTPTN